MTASVEKPKGEEIELQAGDLCQKGNCLISSKQESFKINLRSFAILPKVFVITDRIEFVAFWCDSECRVESSFFVCA